MSKKRCVFGYCIFNKRHCKKEYIADISIAAKDDKEAQDILDYVSDKFYEYVEGFNNVKEVEALQDKCSELIVEKYKLYD